MYKRFRRQRRSILDPPMLSSLSNLCSIALQRICLVNLIVIRQITVYGKVEEAVQHQSVAQSLMIELSRSRKRNITILFAFLGYYAQLAQITAAEWIIFLILLSSSISAFCDSISPHEFATIRPSLFAFLHTIPSVSVRVVLVAEMIRVSENLAMLVCQLCLALGIWCLLCLLKRPERDESSGDDVRLEDGIISQTEK
ncbi:hypothetical protein D9758_010341 [Tetrapyrgos nigripes]|uniref:Uncharacterized protein n=1 Tax=Tetrapyrgos nigripes TaxID=182062 RepID=A0A8H5FUZ7_9AGAR|nr:hypothetical protein D9758_010341 [Tetrapyrgos nigripes]